MPTHPYFAKDGTMLPGTTTILSRWKNSGGLMHWAHKIGFNQGLARERPQLYVKRDIAADVGTFIHSLIEWHIHGECSPPPDPGALKPEDIARGRNGFEQFLRWEERTRVFIISWEKPLVSERYRFGGTPDALFEYEGKVRMSDWKSATGIYADNLLQVGGAYVLLWEENFPDHPLEDCIDVVRFSKDFGDVDHRSFSDLAILKRQFLRLREAYDDDKLIEARV